MIYKCKSCKWKYEEAGAFPSEDSISDHRFKSPKCPQIARDIEMYGQLLISVADEDRAVARREREIDAEQRRLLEPAYTELKPAKRRATKPPSQRAEEKLDRLVEQIHAFEDVSRAGPEWIWQYQDGVVQGVLDGMMERNGA